jgi:hypothetical protein
MLSVGIGHVKAGIITAKTFVSLPIPYHKYQIHILLDTMVRQKK